jgi:putative ABC transport system permease protein
MIRNFLKIAGRNLYKRKSSTLINILGLALGTCACLVIYLIAGFELSFDRFHPDKDRIFRIVSDQQYDGKTSHLGFVTDPMAMTIRQEVSGFEAVSGFYTYYAKVTVENKGGNPRRFEIPNQQTAKSTIIVTDPQYFQIFTFQWLAGNPSTALQAPFQVVLSETEAQRYFGAKSMDEILGRQVIYNDSLRLTVSGVVKDWTANTDFAFKDFISAATIAHSFLKNDIDLSAWGMWNDYSQALVKLAPGVTVKQVEAQFPAFLDKHLFKEKGYEAKIRLQPLGDIHFNAEYGDAFSRKVHLPTLYGLMGIAGFILIIAAINFINLSTSQSLQRAKEIGVRKVLGSSRIKLMGQFMTETLLLTTMAVLLSMLLVRPVLNLFHTFMPPGLQFNLTPFTAIFLVLVVLVTTVIAGLYPAKVLASYPAALSLKGQVSASPGGGALLRKSLIVFQFTVSLLFIISTLVISKQIHFVLNKDMGFRKDAIINIQTSWNYPLAKQALLVEKIKELHSVDAVSQSAETPAARGHRGTNLKYMAKQEVQVDAQMELADEHFIPLYRIPLLAGRNLDHSDTMHEFLINRTCAEQLGFKTPSEAIGKFVQSGQTDSRSMKWCPIVGVVEDFHSQSLHEPIKSVFIGSNAGASRTLSIKLLTGAVSRPDLQISVAQIRKIWKEIYPDEKFDYHFFDQTIAGFYENEQKTSALVNLAMGIAIFISCMGLFGLAAFSAQQRTKEIGIRKVLGASVHSIVTLLSADFVKLVAIATVIATPIAWYLTSEWLQNFAYRISVTWWTFALAGLALLLFTMATVCYRAIKAAIANPVKSLRSE